MMKTYFFALLMSILSLSCNEIEDGVLPLVGVYDAYVTGVGGPFSINLSANGNDDISIDAPFDGDVWSVIEADLNDLDSDKIKVNINHQWLAPNVGIEGDGFFYQGNLQLDYTIDIGGDKVSYRLVGTKY